MMLWPEPVCAKKLIFESPPDAASEPTHVTVQSICFRSIAWLMLQNAAAQSLNDTGVPTFQEGFTAVRLRPIMREKFK